ncbi:putative GARP complex subunit (Sac2) [Aspergillus brunneoviolaceus CBS 621.78]|uniref:Vps52-domain-containing protein n=1 Tax=Aspergillus brunneoviolaceus CBS 621.78 TaxID=1450534 RepID=A0ACD1GIZ0_9EURO|nr:Vps52-domain-containing protein [Aspergillus brunneoviolaceus CBS 621.78]RAH49069.1 Vps52-domain-containing protein [Aspergillus brunneoviolaceus CBS 621.78]
MWLDRIAGHSTPSGPQVDSRSNSPLPPRRTSSRLSPNIQNNRPGSSRQTSSLSVLLTPSDSTTSLPATARGDRSPLRQIAARSRPSDVADPLDVLNGILGKQDANRDSSLDVVPDSKPSELVEDVDFQGLSLEDFVSKKDEPRRIISTDVGAQTVQQFEREQNKFQDLHSAITSCDEVSSSMETYLNDFQNELGTVSAEIETLQSRSIQLTAMLENRRNVEQLLGPAVEEISISPKTVKLIAEGPIDENWVKALNEMESRSASIEAKVSGPNSTKSVEDVRPLLTDIKNKAVERIRDYLVSQIRALRSPNINAQILQQQRLVKFKDLYSYISRAHPALTGQITQAYINTMRWYYFSHFTRYRQALESIKIYPSDRNEVLGGDPSAHKTASAVAGSRAGSAAHDPFSLGRRVDILRTGAQIAISSYLAEEDNSFHGLEVPFRNFNLAVVDNVSAEYSFMTEMFSTLTFQQISRKAVEIFEPVFGLGQALTKQLIEHTTDALGVLICVRLNQHAAFELQRRKVPVADSYINGVNMQLWPRFQVIMDTQCESLKRVAANTGRSAVSALSLAGGDDLNKSSAPHFLTQRFGQLLHGILVLSSDAGDDEPVANSLKRLTAEFDNLLTKLSRIGGDAKRRERFLYNNYSLVLAIISDTQGKLAVEQKQSATAAARADVTHAVIGGGVVGLAVARELAGCEGTSTILLERHDAPGTETSSRNSEVIHAGLYYGSDTLKARLCIQGKEMLYDLLQRQGLPYRNTGKWLVAQDAVERDSLERMHEHAQRIGVPTRFLSQQEQERREPEVRALAGVLESPTTGIFDSHSLITYLQGDLEHRGGDCAFLTRVTGLRHLGPGQGYEITAVSADGAETAITAETVVNSAGLGACAVSNMLLPAERHRTMHYAKGTYLSYAASFPKTSVLVYPAVTKAQAGLGIHLTLDMGGQIRFGPDSEWVDSPEDLAPNPARLEPALPLIKKYLPNVDVNAISVSYCGIRPKLSKTSGSSFGSSKVWQDFEIREEEGFPGFINLLGIESPGLTSSLAIGKMVKAMLY